MFSQTVEYALRAIVFLCRNEGQSFKVAEISSHTQIPKAYLSKILQDISKSAILSSKRGSTGGYQIAKTPSEIQILEIINLVDPIERIKTCPLKLTEHQSDLCPLHAQLDLAIQGIECVFSSVTIGDLLKDDKCLAI